MFSEHGPLLDAIRDKSREDNMLPRNRELIDSVAGKLLTEGVTPENFDMNRAVRILMDTTTCPVACVLTLERFQPKVLAVMRTLAKVNQ